MIRGPHASDGKVMISVRISLEVAAMLDHHQKRVSAGRWRRSERVTKSEIVEEALRRYLTEAASGREQEW